MKYVTDEFKDNLLSLRTSRFGKVVEVMVQKLLELDKGQNIHHDLFDKYRWKRVEVKSSKVMRKLGNHERITKDNVLEVITSGKDRRLLNSNDMGGVQFDSAILQVKPNDFDILVYALFFENEVKLFLMTVEELLEDPEVKYCDYQHKGNKGEGQFHVTHNNYSHHMEKYYAVSLSYDVILNLLLNGKEKSRV